MRLAAILGLGVVAGLTASHFAWRALVAAPDGDPTAAPVVFRVAPGEGFGSVASRLEGEGLVVSANRFKLLARLSRADRQMHAGTYELPRGADPRRLLDDFVDGRVRHLRLTVPEGLRLPQIAALVEEQLGVPAEKFLAAASDSGRIAAIGDGAPGLEGYLFPETYLLPDPTNADEIVDTMRRRFEEVWNGLPDTAPHGLTRHEIVTLASIVEAEASVPDERSRIAAVYLNRVAEGWKLEADPTVRYALGRFTGRLYYKHLDIESPYNTYRNVGFPPGPICAPGRGALAAVFEPLTPCDDFFFVASGDGSGRHIFSKTLAEHDRARALARRAGEEAAATGG